MKEIEVLVQVFDNKIINDAAVVYCEESKTPYKIPVIWCKDQDFETAR